MAGQTLCRDWFGIYKVNSSDPILKVFKIFMSFQEPISGSFHVPSKARFTTKKNPSWPEKSQV